MNDKSSSSRKTTKKLINKRAKVDNKVVTRVANAMYHEIGNYGNYHTLFPKNAKLIPCNSNVPKKFEETYGHDFDFSAMSAFQKNLWNLLLQQHPTISEGNCHGYLSYYFEKLVILASFKKLKDWKRSAVEKILNNKKEENSYDSDRSTDFFFF